MFEGFTVTTGLRLLNPVGMGYAKSLLQKDAIGRVPLALASVAVSKGGVALGQGGTGSASVAVR